MLSVMVACKGIREPKENLAEINFVGTAWIVQEFPEDCPEIARGNPKVNPLTQTQDLDKYTVLHILPDAACVIHACATYRQAVSRLALPGDCYLSIHNVHNLDPSLQFTSIHNNLHPGVPHPGNPTQGDPYPGDTDPVDPHPSPR